MEAYNLKELLEEIKKEGLSLKDAGLELGEESAKKLMNAAFSWLEKSAKASSTPYDDIALIVLPQLKAKALELAEKINPNG